VFFDRIGSETKRVRVVRRLAQSGVAKDAIARPFCSIGIAGAGGKLLAKVAISVAARILHIEHQMATKGIHGRMG